VEYGAGVVSAAWTVRDSKGELLSRFSGGSRLEVARKLLPAHYDAFRLEVSSSYREQFDRHLSNVLKREEWRIVPLKRHSSPRRRNPTTQLEFAFN
jgi:hypothetical protein